MSEVTEKKVLKKKDFMSDQEVKWCPGCGDYAILSAVQMSMAKLGFSRHEVAVISGIGCSSRFPYYMNTYGMHSIHGRAPAFVTGLRVQNPELSVWMITGDGDGLSIGGNHLAHIIRRNVDVNIILFNNEIYGLTKGQYSPTSDKGTVTKSSPYGSIDRPFTPGAFAMGAGTTFFARTIDTDPKHMMETFAKAQAHRGCSVIEVYQNCVIFNDKVHDEYTNRKTRDDHSVRLEIGEEATFGADKDKKLSFSAEEGFCLSDENNKAYTHNAKNEMKSLDLIKMQERGLPVALGVIHQKENVPVYEEQLHEQIGQHKSSDDKLTDDDLHSLLHSGHTWKVD
jgi:2-oxoglutarate ferredoxin oxidoreductase subunit beta